MQKTISAIELLKLCDYDVEGKSKGAIRKLASDLRRRYHLAPVQKAPRGFRYDLRDVLRKVPAHQLAPQ